MAEGESKQDQPDVRDRRDKPVEQEGDKDIKEGGIAGARKRLPERRPEGSG